MNEQQVGKASHIASLIIRRMQNQLSDDESMQLEAWLQEDGENYLLYEDLMDEEQLGQALNQLHAVNHEVAYDRLSQRLFPTEEVPKRISPRIWWYMAAALLILVAGGLYMFLNNSSTITPTPPLLVTAQSKQTGVAPDSQKAVLILADSSIISLSTVNNGPIAKQGNSSILKTDNGNLQYQFAGTSEMDLGYNTIRTPRGGEYQLVLHDGTRIWLNAGSTLRYPVHFSGADRRVQLTGEAYFEVAKATVNTTGQSRAFIVQVNGIDVQALGTAFNINGYKEEQQTQTTVIEGLVKVSGYNKQQLLSPGKKLVASDTSFNVEEADIRLETAWKNRLFAFKNTPLESIMNEISRWYDVDVEYKAKMSSLHFSGEIERDVSIDAVLQKLELTGGVRFTRENGKVQVYPTASY